MRDRKLFDQMAKRMDKATDNIKRQMMQDYYRALSKNLSDDKVTVETSGDSEITVKQEVEEKKVIDLKQFFRRSNKVNRTDKGGWYLIVPIRRYTRGAKKSSGMSRKMYDELRSAPGSGNTTLISDYLYTNRRVSPIPELNYNPKSKTITRLKNKQGRGNTYVSFRTVSNTSAPSSWLINRDKATEENLTPRIKSIINQVRRNNQK